MLASTLSSNLPPASAFADLTSITVERDQTLPQAERKIRATLRTYERWISRSTVTFLGEIERMIDEERRGSLALSDEELTSLIGDVGAGEADLRTFLRSAERAFRRLADAAGRDGEDRRELVRLAGREFLRLLGRNIAALQEGRWMLVGLRDGREPKEGGEIVSAPQDLRRLLTAP